MSIKTTDAILIAFVGVALVTLAFFVRIGATVDKVVVLQVDGITCDGCVVDIKKALQAKEGIALIEINVKGGRVTVGYDSKKIGVGGISSAIVTLGYRNNVSQVMSIEQYRALTRRAPGNRVQTIGCTSNCSSR